MIEKNPRCALCGGNIPERGSLIMRFEFVLGRPSVGWCENCAEKDTIIQEIRGSAKFEDVDSAIYAIGKRGTTRVHFERVKWEASQKTPTSSRFAIASRSGCQGRTPRTR